jgi:hypothetical protein
VVEVGTAMSERRPHPAMSDVAFQLASRPRSEPTSKVTLSDANAKGIVQVTVEVNDPDPKQAAAQADDLYASLRDKYPRENGGSNV